MKWICAILGLVVGSTFTNALWVHRFDDRLGLLMVGCLGLAALLSAVAYDWD